MSASGDPRPEWLARLDQVTPDEAEELRSAWKDYCEVIAGPSRLIAGVCKLAAQRNEALRLFVAGRHATDLAAQREFWLEFSWIDQEYRAAVHQLAEFCRQRLAAQAASPRDQSDDVSMETCVTSGA